MMKQITLLVTKQGHIKRRHRIVCDMQSFHCAFTERQPTKPDEGISFTKSVFEASEILLSAAITGRGELGDELYLRLTADNIVLGAMDIDGIGVGAFKQTIIGHQTPIHTLNIGISPMADTVGITRPFDFKSDYVENIRQLKPDDRWGIFLPVLHETAKETKQEPIPDLQIEYSPTELSLRFGLHNGKEIYRDVMRFKFEVK